MTFFVRLQVLLQHKWYVGILFAVVGLLCYSNVLQGEFLFDDDTFIVKNQFVRKAQWADIFSHGITQGSGLQDNFYRPLQQSIFALIYKVGELNTLYYHLASVGLHIFNAFVLFALLSLLFPAARWSNLVVAFIFLVHPVQTQAVAYISGLSEPLFACFVLLALWAFASFLLEPEKRPVLKTISVIVAAALALLSKESGVVAAPLLWLLAFYWMISAKKSLTRWQWSIPIAVTLMAVSFAILKMTLLNFTGNFGLSDQSNIYNEQLSIRITTFLNILPKYFQKICWPAALHYETPYTAYIDFTSSGAAVYLLALTGFMGWFIYLAYKRITAVPLLGMAWFFAALLPYMGIVPLNSMYLEHWLYLPLVGFCITLAWLLAKLPLPPVMWACLLIPLLLGFSLRTYARNAQWANAEKFYLNELKYTKKSARMHNNLAMIYADRNQCEKAVPHYQKAIALYDVYPQSHHNLARCYEALGRPADAATEYYRALLINPNFLYSHNRLPAVLLQVGDTLLAERFLQLQIQLDKGKPLSPADIQRAADIRQPM